MSQKACFVFIKHCTNTIIFFFNLKCCFASKSSQILKIAYTPQVWHDGKQLSS